MREIRVRSWNELNDTVYAESYQPEIGRTRSRFVFRGFADVAYPPTTSLMRLGGDYRAMEQHLLRNFRKYARRTDVPYDSVWNWLAVAQHHGLPTRLLDWTFSPQVAMHFATARVEHFGLDGAIWAIDFRAAHRLLPAALRAPLEAEGSDVFTVEMLDRNAATLDAFHALADDPFLLFFEPPSLDERIVNQFALFSVVSDPSLSVEAWVRSHPEICRKIVIPSGLKWEIRDKLDQANITERVLFPGLDGLSRWLKRYYSPRDPPPPDERSAV